jgi:hypothetical protein
MLLSFPGLRAKTPTSSNYRQALAELITFGTSILKYYSMNTPIPRLFPALVGLLWSIMREFLLF